MKKTKLGEIESQFADLIWQNEPLSTAELVNLCEKNSIGNEPQRTLY